jgi:hypothetical protein
VHVVVRIFSELIEVRRKRVWGRRSGPSVRIKHPLQQSESVIPGSDSMQIALRGMARGAATNTVEITAPGCGVSGCQVRIVDGAAPAAQRFGIGLLVVDEGDDRGQIGIAQIKGRHAFWWAATANEGADFIAAIVFGDELGASEVRPSFSARGVAAMAEAALRSEA